MKTSLLALFMLIFLAPYAQNSTPNLPIDGESRRIVYTEVVQVDTSTTKNELYSRALEWFAKSYKSSKNVIQLEDKEGGKIVGKALMQVYHKALGKDYESGHINYTISIYLKDGRYKYDIINFHHTGQLVRNGGSIPSHGACEDMINTSRRQMGISYQKTYNYYLQQLDANMQVLIESLKKGMAITATPTDDNW